MATITVSDDTLKRFKIVKSMVQYVNKCEYDYDSFVDYMVTVIENLGTDGIAKITIQE